MPPRPPLCFHLLATTEKEFYSFAPYVPSIRRDGLVCFQSTLDHEKTAVFIASSTKTAPLFVQTPDTTPWEFVSHPDLNDHEHFCVYAQSIEGQHALLFQTGEDWSPVVVTGSKGCFSALGPLGPTMNNKGQVAFRATTQEGEACIALWDGGQSRILATTGSEWFDFQGLPVVAESGDVIFRADAVDGRQVVLRARRVQGEVEVLLETGGRWSEFGRFPALHSNGDLLIPAMTGNKEACLLCRKENTGEVKIWVQEEGFESIRGGLFLSESFVFYATPRGGTLGLYWQRGGERRRLFGLEEHFALNGRNIFLTGFALNPVSSNEQASIAVRLLGNEEEWIVRIEGR